MSYWQQCWRIDRHDTVMMTWLSLICTRQPFIFFKAHFVCLSHFVFSTINISYTYEFSVETSTQKAWYLFSVWTQPVSLVYFFYILLSLCACLPQENRNCRSSTWFDLHFPVAVTFVVYFLPRPWKRGKNCESTSWILKLCVNPYRCVWGKSGKECCAERAAAENKHRQESA